MKKLINSIKNRINSAIVSARTAVESTAGEGYAALSLNKEAVGGSIVATNSTINVAAGSDSFKGRNGAENGTVTIDGSSDDVVVIVAVITYAGSNYYHGFASLADAIEFAKVGDTITLIRNINEGDINVTKVVTIDVNGYTVNANLILAADAKITAEEVLTVSAVEGYKSFYTEGAYIAIAADIVAYNLQTGVYYNTVQGALNAAAKNETVVMIADSTESFIFVGNNKTLDLNGYTLTAEIVSASFANSQIIDATNGEARLFVNKNDISLSENNAQLPLWSVDENGNDYARFIDVTLGRALAYQNNGDRAYYRFAIMDKAANTILDDYLAGGNSCISIRVKITWTNSTGTVTQYVDYNDELIQAYLNWQSGWDRAMFTLYLNGASTVTNLSFTAEVVSTANPEAVVVVASTPIG